MLTFLCKPLVLNPIFRLIGNNFLCSGSSEDRIVYDDKSVSQLLDRSQVGQEEKEMAMNEYLDSFKVASYQMKEGEDEVRNILFPPPHPFL